jgi:hypothetical protein
MPDRIVKLRPDDLEWREVEGEVVALDLRSSRYLAVNHSGTVLWPALHAGATREALTARLRDTCGLDAAAAARDVDSFLDMLASEGLLESP